MSESEVLLNSKQVRQRFGGVSDMSLWRWTHDEKMGFPQPIRINRRKYWRKADLDAFADRMAEEAA